LPLIDRDSIDLSTDNQLKSGTPTGYYIAPTLYGDSSLGVWLDKDPSDGEYLTVWYYAQISRMQEGQLSVPLLSGTDSTNPGTANDGTITLGTDLGSLLDGATVQLNGPLNKTVQLIYNKIDVARLDDNEAPPSSLLPHKYSGAYSSYYHNVDLAGEETSSKTAYIAQARKYSPIVPQMYRISLCNYAIALSQAKANPELHDKHYQMWLQDVEKIKNEQADKSLNHTIKEVI